MYAVKTKNSKQTNNLNHETEYHTNKDISKNIDNVLNNISERNPVRLRDYHISSNALRDINCLISGTYDTSQDIKLRDYTPKELVNVGVKDLPMLMNSSHILDNILTINDAKNMRIYKPNTNYHGLGVKNYLEIIDSLDHPLAIYQWNNKTNKKYTNKDYVILTNKTINGENIIVPVYVETKGNYNYARLDTNKIKTIYGKANIFQTLEDRAKNGEMTKIFDKQKTNIATTVNTAVTGNSFSANNIPQNDSNVKLPSTKYSMQENVNNTQENQTWQEHLEENFLSTGTRTYFEDIKLPKAQTGVVPTVKTQNLLKAYFKTIQDKKYNVLFDSTITNEKGQVVDALVTSNENGEVIIKVNPNSNRAGEFLLIHEISHAIKTQEMIDIVINFASQNQEFANVVKSIEQQYGKDLTSEEVFADVCGQLFGSQEFINSLTTQNTPQSRNIIKRIYESITRLLNNFTEKGRYRNFVQDLESKWRNAYRTQVNNLEGNTNYHVDTLKDGTVYVRIENNLFLNKDGSKMSEREIYNSLVGKEILLNDGIKAKIVNRLPNKNMYNELFKRYPTYQNVKDIKTTNKTINENIEELLSMSNNVSPNEPDFKGRHAKQGIKSFDTRKVSFFDGKYAYDLDLSIAKLNDGSYIAYAKRNLAPNNNLLANIKKEKSMSKSQLASLNGNNIP